MIRPLGILDEGEKHAILEASTMLLLPSHSDSFGIVILEAWAHGKPVIGARAGGIPGVIDDATSFLPWHALLSHHLMSWFIKIGHILIRPVADPL